MHEDKETKYVRWQIFIWAMGIVLIIFGILFNAQAATNGKVGDLNESHDDIQERLIRLEQQNKNDSILLNKIADKLNVL